MNSYEHIINFTDDNCRTCMAKDEDLVSIFKFDSESGNIAKKVMECANVQIAPNDGFPFTICEKCVEKVNIAYNFKIRCEEVDTILRENKNIIVIEEFNVQNENSPDTQSVQSTDDISYIDPLNYVVKVEEKEPEAKCFALEVQEHVEVVEENFAKEPTENTKRRVEKKKVLSKTECSMCGKVVFSRNFKKHVETHSKEKHIDCKTCGLRFGRDVDLRRHEIVHANEDASKENNDKSDVESENYEYYDDHAYHEKPENDVQNADPLLHIVKMEEPEHEEVVFADKQIKEISPQKKKNSRRRRTVCFVCGKVLIARNITSHMQMHVNGKCYECKTCGHRFARRVNLRRHEMIHTGERPHKCNECGKGFIQATSLRTHLLKHTNPDPETNHNVTHERRKGILRRRRCLDDVERPFACSICGLRYITKAALQTHQRIHGEKSLFCDVCGKGFSTKLGLKQHSIKHTGEKSFHCDICNKSFPYYSSLSVHKLRHTGEKPFKCTICEKSFRQSTHLKIHLQLHTGYKPYECCYCEKTFATKGNLTVHTRIHTGETPFSCPICGKGFHDSSSMKRHQRGHNTNVEDLTETV